MNARKPSTCCREPVEVGRNGWIRSTGAPAFHVYCPKCEHEEWRDAETEEHVFSDDEIMVADPQM